MAAQRGHTKWGGRRKGTPNKVTREIKAAFQKHGDELVKGLIALTKSKDERVRLGAIQAALDRGWGKAVQAMELDVELPITKIVRQIVGPQIIESVAVEVSESVSEGDGDAWPPNGRQRL